MKYYKHPGFMKSVSALDSRGGSYRNAATKVFAILAKVQEQEFSSSSSIFNLKETKNKEIRIPNCIKYELDKHCRLITTRSNNKQVFLFAGTHDDAERWLNNHNGKALSELEIHKKEDNIPVVNVFQSGNINIPTDIHDIIAAEFNNLLTESLQNQYDISSRRKEIAGIRQDIRIKLAEINDTDPIDCDKQYEEQSEIIIAKKDIGENDCPNLLAHVQKINDLVRENKIKSASELIEPMEGNVALLKLRLKYIQSLEILVSEMKAEILFRKKLHKLAIALGLDVPDKNEKKIPVEEMLV